jgi:prepilin-type N-terminal cleavage/methylation domain-containing protein
MKSNKGFTLIEVLVAFVVLVLISAALLQTFVVSAKLNRRAYDIDKATALAVRIQEVFRRDTSQFRDGDISYLEANVDEMLGADNVFTYTISPDTKEIQPISNMIKQYLDSDWKSTADTNAPYLISVDIAYGKNDLSEDSYYPDANLVFFLDLASYKTDVASYSPSPIYIEITANDENAMSTYTDKKIPTTYTSSVTGDIVLVLDNKGVKIDTDVNIIIYNDSSKKIKLYVLDAPQVSSPNEVKIVKDLCDGLYEYSIVPSSDFSELTDTMTVAITRRDGTVLAKSSVTGYYKYDETGS